MDSLGRFPGRKYDQEVVVKFQKFFPRKDLVPSHLTVSLNGKFLGLLLVWKPIVNNYVKHSRSVLLSGACTLAVLFLF